MCSHSVCNCLCQHGAELRTLWVLGNSGHSYITCFHLRSGGRWRLGAKHFFNQRGAKVTAVDFHRATGMLVVGFSNGIFDLFEVCNLFQPALHAPLPICLFAYLPILPICLFAYCLLPICLVCLQTFPQLKEHLDVQVDLIHVCTCCASIMLWHCICPATSQGCMQHAGQTAADSRGDHTIALQPPEA